LRNDTASGIDNATNLRQQRRPVIPRSNEFDRGYNARDAVGDPCGPRALIAENIEFID
jgi:hypothetical protein